MHLSGGRAGGLCLRVGVEPLFGAGGVDVVKLLLFLGLDVLVLLHPAGVFDVSPVGRQNHEVVDHSNNCCPRSSKRHNKQVEGHVQLSGFTHPQEILRNGANFLFLSNCHNPKLTKVQAEIRPLHQGGVSADGPQVEVHVNWQGGERRHSQPGQHEQVRQHDKPGAHTSAASGDFEIPVQIFDGTSCEEAFHHQQNAIYKERSCDAVDHILKNVNHGEDVQRVSRGPGHLEVGLQNVDSPRKRFMATAAEQGNPGVEQDCGNQGGVGNAPQAFDTALKTPCGAATETCQKSILLLALSNIFSKLQHYGKVYLHI